MVTIIMFIIGKIFKTELNEDFYFMFGLLELIVDLGIVASLSDKI